MNLTKTHILFVVLLFSGFTMYSQKHAGNYDQLFRSGTQTPVENLDAFLNTPDVARDEIMEGKFYRLVQFYEIPTELEKRSIIEAGIELFDYLPHKTYVAAIDSGFSEVELRKLNIRSISRLEFFQKIAPSFLNEEGHEKITLQYFPNLSKDYVSRFLKNKNIEIHAFYENINALVICKNMELEILAKFPITFFLSPFDTEHLPEYLPGKNIHRSNVLNSSITGTPQYNGEGINIAIGDDGMIESHIDFKNRLAQDDVLGDLEGSHGEMVAGLLAGAGNLDPQMEGTANHATIHMLDKFETVLRADALYNDRNILITSTSYSDGCNRGYTPLAQLADHQVQTNTSLMHVFSAGNTGNEDCGYGAGKGWGNITGGVKMGKNVLTVANIDANDTRPSSSSRGPANDGRIKPDISANGDGQISTQPNNTYGEANGSSAAAPGVAGVLGQLYQAFYQKNNNTLPDAALIKAAVLNTADDIGNMGPDFSYGFGRINARRAWNVLNNQQYFSGTLNHSNTHSHFIQVPQKAQQLKVMLYWNDVEGSTISTPALVNDLDLRVVNSMGTTYLPWILNSSPDSNLLNIPATRGVDHLNNVEQVTIDISAGGLYSFLVEGSSIAHGVQSYFLVYEFLENNITLTYPLGGEKLIPGNVERIHWDAFGADGNFEIEVSYNNGLTWEVIGLVTGEKRSLLWQIPTLNTNRAKIRIKRDNQQGISSTPFTIHDVPQDVHIAEACPDLIRLAWTPCSNTSQYLVYKLGEKFMEVFDITDMPSIEIPIDDPTEENWYAVAAMGTNGLVSQRSIAVSDGWGLLNCELDTDISIHSIATPSNAVLQSCFQNPLTVSINISNTGSSMQSAIPVFYQFDNQPVVSEVFDISIPSGITINYIFNQKIPPSPIGTHQLKVWTAQINDQAVFNDSLDFQLEIVPSAFADLPYFQNFDNFQNCDVEANCDEPCPLTLGWYNDPNQLADDTDWLVHQGATPTSGTGPSFDQNTNEAFGKYLYLEGSRGCIQQDAFLLSPCFDLNTATQPIFSFWYHMKGMHIGRLHVDLFDGHNWFYNITPPLTGEQGDDWKEIEIDLTAFATKTVNIRFRGQTGEDYLTDIAIDNVALFDAQSEPYPNFKANKVTNCPQQKIQFIDNSVNMPTSWEWKFEPNTITFLDGTSATDINPVVAFNEVGNYDVTLITANNFGSTQITKQQYIHISTGASIPYKDNFNSSILDLEKWKLENTDHSTTWTPVSTTGRDGQSTNAIFMNNHSYNAIGERDELHSQVIDLTTADQPYLRFDWAYAQFNNNFGDGLMVLLSSDCGEHFDHVLFEKYEDDLATVPNQITSWFPSKGYEWKTAKIDLSNFIGSSVIIRFININGFGNNLFLDNFLVYEYKNLPTSSFVFYPEEMTFCVGEEAVTFLTNVKPEYDFLWSFGENALPLSSANYGPHVVNFTKPGTYNISLRVANELGYDMAETVIEVIDEPIADFDYSLNYHNATFTNHSTFGETFLWEFGDGTTSTLENPIHEYQDNNAYTAKLTVTNKCGESSTEQILVIITGIDDLENNFFINAYPNPTNDVILLNMPSLNQRSVLLDIIDSRGVNITSLNLKENKGLFSHQLNLEKFASGMYFARVQINGKTFIKRFIKI